MRLARFNTIVCTTRLHGKIKLILRTFVSWLIHDSVETAENINNTKKRSRSMLGDAFNKIATLRNAVLYQSIGCDIVPSVHSYRSAVKMRKMDC